jgi:prepilin peptidase CpaA
MSGRTDFFLYFIFIFSIISAVTDLLRGRIYNWLTLPAIGLGLVASAAFGGWSVAGDALLGVGVGFMLYSWMFWVGLMGGGDVKLLMALGAWGGYRYAFDVGIFGILVGGAIALIILIFTGQIVGFYRRMYRALLTLFVRELEFEAPKVDRKRTMPFGVSIAIAAIWVALSNPMVKWGLRPW